LKNPVGSVRFRFYKQKTKKTEPNRNKKKTGKKTEPNQKNRAKTKNLAKTEKNRAKIEKTEPKPEKPSQNRKN